MLSSASGSVKNKSPFSFSLANSRQIAGREGSIVELGRRDRLLRSEPRSIDLTFPLLVARKPLKAPWLLCLGLGGWFFTFQEAFPGPRGVCQPCPRNTPRALGAYEHSFPGIAASIEGLSVTANLTVLLFFPPWVFIAYPASLTKQVNSGNLDPFRTWPNRPFQSAGTSVYKWPRMYKHWWNGK